jgi:hypothetical protein
MILGGGLSVRDLFLKMQPNAPDQRGGVTGEHRMVRLIAPLPKETAGQIRSAVAIFSLDDKAPVLSPVINHGAESDYFLENGRAHIVLWQALTQCRTLRVQVEGYGDENGKEFIDRTMISERVIFGHSIVNAVENVPEIEQQNSAFAQLLAWMHTHSNQPVLDLLCKSDDFLYFNGAKLATADELEAEADERTEEDENIRKNITPLTNIELDALINQALMVTK